MNQPPALDRLINELSKLPGVGKKSARRIAFALVFRPNDEVQALAKSILNAKEVIQRCDICNGIAESDICSICNNSLRDHKTICVVEDPRNIFTIETSGVFNGVYHVLGGAISPVNGIGPDELTIGSLEKRVKNENINELILATNPTLEGEATAHYLTDLFTGKLQTISRLARGMPMGGDLEFSDPGTLSRAFEDRTNYSVT